MVRDPIIVDCGTYVVAQGRDLDDSAIRTYPLFTDESLRSNLDFLRGMLARDEEMRAQAGPLEGPVVEQLRKYAGFWFQRADFPEHGVSTVSDLSWIRMDEGGVNTLGRRLTSAEACMLRPWPKWIYLREHMPDMRGKSVLEIGSNSGFFPRRFSEMGAALATGVEIQKHMHEMAVFVRDTLGYTNIDLRHSDFLTDLTIPPHDIVFTSETVNHMLCPLWGLARMISLAKEWLILDTGVFESSAHSMELSTGWQKNASLPTFLSYQITDGLLCSYFRLFGIRPVDIEKWVEEGAGHILYLINTRHAHKRIAEGEAPLFVKYPMTMQFRFPAVTP